MTLWAVVPAAGTGKRFGGETPKQYLSLHGKTIMQWTLDLLTGLDDIRTVMVAIHPEDTRAASLDYRHPARLRFTPGGQERADSVLAGLKALPAEAGDWVLVHDVARPCVPVADIRRLLDTVAADPVGGILAMPVRDTLKLSASHGRHIVRTVDRNGIWQAQTPQLFRYGVLRQALEAALSAGMPVTDEASAVEQAGLSPLLVPGSIRNLKITWPDDLDLAALLLSDSAR